MDDLDGITTSQAVSGEGIDPLYARLMGQQFQEEDRAEQENVVPRDEYAFVVQSAKGSVNKWQDKTFVSARLALKITEGAQAVGRVAFVDLPLTPETDVYDEGKGAYRPATPAEYAKNEETFGKTMAKVQRVFGLATLLPPQQIAEAITAWLKPSIGRPGVGGIYVKNTKNGEKNALWWGNLASPDEQTFKKTKAGKTPKGTAIECLRAAVAKKLKKATPQSGNGLAVGGGLD